jgi:hypothetical protein
VAPGSVLITATIDIPPSATLTASTVQASLVSRLGTAASASAALGLTVGAQPHPLASSPNPDPNLNPDP